MIESDIKHDKSFSSVQRSPSNSSTGSKQEVVDVVSGQNFKQIIINDQDEVRPTSKRYVILLLFCLHSMINSLQWIYLCSITNLVSKYYQVDNLAINWTSMIYMLVYIPLIVPSSWLFEIVGMRKGVILGSLGTSLGSIIKCFCCDQGKFPLLMFGQTIVAISQLFVLSVPPRLASIWFPDDQVSLANACGVFGNQFGIAMGFVLPQLVVIVNEFDSVTNIETGLFRLYLGIAVFSSITTLSILFLFDEKPLIAPGLARLQQIKQENSSNSMEIIDPLVNENDVNRPATTNKDRINFKFGSLLLDLFTDKNFVLLMVSYGLNVGVFYALSTILNQMIAPKTVDENTLVGRLGLVMVISGMFGSIISGYLLDKTRKYNLINTLLYGCSLASIIIFTLSIELRNTLALYLTVALLGYFMTGYLLIGFEMSNEITWPKPESVSAGLLNLSAQVFGVALTSFGSTLVDSRGNLTTNIFFIAAILFGMIVTILIKAQLKRQNALDP